MFSLLHFLGGYCRVALSGNRQERFLNLCAGRRILIWKLRRENGHYLFTVSRAGYRELEEIGEKCGCAYRCVGKRGLPYVWSRYRKRKCLLLLGLLCAGLLYYLSLFLWQIEVVGCRNHPEEEILSYLEKNKIVCGKRLSAISCAELEEKLREDYPDVAWASCEKKGTCLRVWIKETLDVAETEETEETPCDLVAQKAGTIDSIVVRSGVAMVKKGDQVKAGDVLISGSVSLYDDSGEVVETKNLPAQGEITATTTLSYEDSFSLLHYEKEKTGERAKAYRLMLGNYIFPQFPALKSYEDCEETQDGYRLHIGQFYLPCALLVTTREECRTKGVTYGKKEAREEAERKLNAFLAEYETKGVEILKNNVKINCDDTACTAAGTVLIRERLGKVREMADGGDAEGGTKE